MQIMQKKIKVFYIMLLVLSVFTISCGKKENNEDDNKFENLKNLSSQIINLIEENSITEGFSNQYNQYNISDGKIYGFNYNANTKLYEYNLNYMGFDNIVEGLVIENSQNEFYLSLKTKELCAIKNFEENEINVYDIAEEEKCHTFQSKDKTVYLNIEGIKEIDYTIYEAGQVTNSNIILLAGSNLIDPNSTKYNWYRNGELIEGEVSNEYIVSSNSEDANYYVEIILSDGKSVKSKPINVKIQK